MQILKFMWSIQEQGQLKQRQKNKVMALLFPDIKTYYKATVFGYVAFVQRDKN